MGKKTKRKNVQRAKKEMDSLLKRCQDDDRKTKRNSGDHSNYELEYDQLEFNCKNSNCIYDDFEVYDETRSSCDNFAKGHIIQAESTPSKEENEEMFWVGILPSVPLNVATDALEKRNVKVISVYPSGPDSDLDYAQVRARESTLRESAGILQFWQRKDRFPLILAN